MNVKFIEYKEVSLYCDGILILEIDGVIWKFGSKPNCDFPKFWSSGGSYDTEGNVTVSPWIVDKINKDEILEAFNAIFHDPYKALEECLRVMNENVEFGCCGECV